MPQWNITIPHRIPLREVWPHEQYDFSTWVRDNIEVVNEQVGLTIDPETLDPESATGAFAADLVGTATDDADGNQVRVVIENQLERTDHDHLGKVLTYIAHHEADVAIWIAAEARPEHVRAIQWLNENSELKAWLFTIEAVAVGERQAAPLLRRIVGPSLLTAAVRRVKQEDSQDAQAQTQFWTLALEHATQRFADLKMYQRHNPRSGVHVWHAIPNNPGRVGWQMWVTAHGSWVCLRLDADSAEQAEHYYQQMLAHRPAIDRTFGEGLDWKSDDSARARMLRWDNPVNGGYRDDPDGWPDATANLVDGLRRLVDATLPYVTHLTSPPQTEGTAAGVAADDPLDAEPV